MENKIKFLGLDIGGPHLKLVGTNTKKKIGFVAAGFWSENRQNQSYPRDFSVVRDFDAVR